MNQLPLICPHCKNDREDMLEFASHLGKGKNLYFCNNCAKLFEVKYDTEPEGKAGSKNPKDTLPL